MNVYHRGYKIKIWSPLFSHKYFFEIESYSGLNYGRSAGEYFSHDEAYSTVKDVVDSIIQDEGMG